MNEDSKEPMLPWNEFIFTDFNGLRLEKLIVCENPETKEPILVYIKVENNNWYQFFLDAGLGFWQSFDEIELEEIEIETDDEYHYPDKTSEFELFNKTIEKIWCETDKSNSQIIIAFENDEKLILRTIEPTIFNSESELIKIKKLH
ncbi:hypothetical protein AR687_14650 [Flavobacteriaceae bacterium CRH]|nr:hypothetical protein AR687_14650 [Flavobacteriaceae bacterium CRH]